MIQGRVLVGTLRPVGWSSALDLAELSGLDGINLDQNLSELLSDIDPRSVLREDDSVLSRRSKEVVVEIECGEAAIVCAL
jgi:hypothetical protein